jgi:hypothetical protein
MIHEGSMFSADLPRPWLATPPGSTPIAAVSDILLVTGDPNVSSSDPDRYPPILMPEFPDGPAGAARDPEPIEMGFDVSLLQLEGAQADRVMNACSSRGHYFHPVRQYGQRYTFVKPVEREDWEASLYGWDSDGVLGDVLAMSRLILDNGYSNEFAARVIERENGEQTVMPLPGGQPVYRLRHTRDWMTLGEVGELRDLVAAFRSTRDNLPTRVRRALWNADYGPTIRWLDIRVPLLVIAFEGLISTSSSLTRRQFRERVPALAEEAGVAGVTPKLCNEMYAARSRWAHGSHIALARETRTEPEPDADVGAARTDADEVAMVALFEEALRAVVRRCIEDGDFATAFIDGDSVRARWPIQI